MVRVPSLRHRSQDGGVIHIVIEDEDKDHQLGGQGPRKGIIQGQLTDLAGGVPAERRGGNVEARQPIRSELLQPDMKLGRNGDLIRRHEGVSDYGYVAALCDILQARRFSVKKAKAIGALQGPEIKLVGEPVNLVRR